MLTNGRPDYLARTLAAFSEHVHPQPSEVYIFDDGLLTPREAFAPYEDATVEGAKVTKGMCAAHAFCWVRAAESRFKWVFHIEDDYVILRPVGLPLMADVIEANPHLVQMTLVRCPWGFEIEHGGYIPKDPGWYVRQGGAEDPSWHPGAQEWIETTRNWAVAPTLFPTAVARKHWWPAERGCETTIGPRILEQEPDARFGLWGWGEPWVAHIGVDRQKGAFGY